MPNTPVYSLPYPAGTDTPDVPRDVAALANRAEAVLLGGVASVGATPPSSPVAGQRWEMLVDAATGVRWTFAYNPSEPTYRWEFIGGGWLAAEVLTDQAMPSPQTTYAPLATPVQLTPPRPGWYDMQYGASMYLGSGGAQLFSAPGGTFAANDADAAMASASGPGLVVSPSRVVRRELTVALQYLFHRSSVAVTMNVYNRWLRIQPVRIS